MELSRAYREIEKRLQEIDFSSLYRGFSRFPYEYDYEARTEQIEGSAHYVENAALAQLDPVNAAEKWERMFIARDFSSHGRFCQMVFFTFIDEMWRILYSMVKDTGNGLKR